MSKMFLGGVIINKKAVIFEQLEIVKNYIDSKDVLNIKSAEFVDDTIRLYASSDKSGEAVAEIALPDETFLDGKKTRLVSDFSWSTTEYPKSTNPELDGKTVLVLAVKSRRTVRYSFISLDSVIAKLVGGETESTSVSVADDVVTLSVKVSELSGNRIIMKDDGLYVGTVDNTPTWTVSTNDEVNAMFSTSGYGAETLGAKNVGDIVKIKEDGVDTNYIVVHKGLPSDMYDDSCDGVWVLRGCAHSQRAYDDEYNDYENSDIHLWLNEDFLNCIEPKIVDAIKLVKIPFYKWVSSTLGKVCFGTEGLPCQCFILTNKEMYKSPQLTVANDGAILEYFNTEDRTFSDEFLNTTCWLRTPNLYYKTKGTAGVAGSARRAASNNIKTDTIYVRPAFILPYSIPVNADGLVL